MFCKLGVADYSEVVKTILASSVVQTRRIDLHGINLAVSPLVADEVVQLQSDLRNRARAPMESRRSREKMLKISSDLDCCFSALIVVQLPIIMVGGSIHVSAFSEVARAFSRARDSLAEAEAELDKFKQAETDLDEYELPTAQEIPVTV